MPALNFKRQFVEAIENGLEQIRGEPLPPDAEVKRQTIRQRRKFPIQVGNELYLYTGMRTKQCRTLGEAICASTEPIVITASDILVSGRRLSWREQCDLARADGFDNLPAMYNFFTGAHGPSFHGDLIKW